MFHQVRIFWEDMISTLQLLGMTTLVTAFQEVQAIKKGLSAFPLLGEVYSSIFG
jgi:hypothetical protein